MGFVVLLAVFSIVCVVFIICWKIDDKKEKESFNAAKEKYEIFYRENDLRTLTNMPDMYVVGDDNYPREKHIPYGYCYGKTVDVYISRTSSYVYHSLGCPHASYQQPCNAFKDYYYYSLHSRRPCSHCRPDPLPDIRWYEQYITHLNICRRYGITPLREPKERT